MWQTDIVILQTKTEVNVLGSINATWTDSTEILCDVQDINKEFVFKTYGITENGEFKQVFDHTQNTNWIKGNQVKYDGVQWWIKLVNDSMWKLGASNHIFILLMKVI
ncbi:MAG: hypothetical protein ACTSPI_04740 [Candidatus Heimdallarchaeaceae archaeon]